MNLSKSVDFLLENAGDVIKYRLHKEILRDISPSAEETLLAKVMMTPYYKLVESYAKPNGYIGVGMHSADRFQQTRLEDGEAAARLLSYYAIPKENPLLLNFVAAMRNDEVLEREFMFYPPAFDQFKYRYDGLHSGTSMMVTVYAMQAMLGWGDDEYVKPFRDISLEAFRNILKADSIKDIAVYNEKLQKRFKTSYYIEQDTAVPCAYHLAALAYTKSWRTPENVDMMAAAINHICGAKLMEGVNGVPVKFHGKYGGSLWLLIYPLKPFDINTIDGVMYRRILSEIAMLGVGTKAEVIRTSAENLKEALSDDGILRWNFTSPYQKQQFRAQKWPTAYCDMWLEDDHKKKNALECDLTFWAVQLLNILSEAEF